jgi:hypothetical protein
MTRNRGNLLPAAVELNGFGRTVWREPDPIAANGALWASHDWVQANVKSNCVERQKVTS